MPKNTKKTVKTIKTVEPIEAEVLSTKTYVEDGREITETAKLVRPDTDVVTTPWGTKVDAHDITKVLDQYYTLSADDKEKEKPAWLSLISKMIGEREDGLRLTDIEMPSTGEKIVKFVYGKDD